MLAMRRWRTVTTSVHGWHEDRVFGAARLYDAAFALEGPEEIDVLQRIAQLDAGSRVLLPACGTGRYALPIAERVEAVHAFDLHPGMVDYARAHRQAPNLDFAVAGMSRPGPWSEARWDAALVLCNSFRYLIEPGQARAHLTLLRDCVRGYIVLEVGLNDTMDDVGRGVQWSAPLGEGSVHAEWTLVSFRPERALDDVRLEARDPAGVVTESLRELQPQRPWTVEAIHALVGEVGLIFEDVLDRVGQPHPDPFAVGRYLLLLRSEGS